MSPLPCWAMPPGTFSIQFFAVHGIQPGVGGFLGSAAAVGAKNALQSLFSTRLRQKKVSGELRRKFAAIEELLKKDETTDGRRLGELRRDEALWRQGLISHEAFDQAIDDMVAAFRSAVLTPSPSSSGDDPEEEKPTREISYSVILINNARDPYCGILPIY
jgi:hypothetical protein